MRLLNTTTVQLEDFFTPPPDYAILSHRWLDGEVSLQDLQSGTGKSKAGYAKIQACCAQALRDGYAYAWVDTCCIDKTSSAELTEAINSMYAWYRDAAVCYAFLSDVSPSTLPDDPDAECASFDESVWFARGWTLQELLAPARVVFYNDGWEDLGERDEDRLAGRIARVTGVDEGVLRGETDLKDVSVARRMAWAAGRTTTRGEDRAYSLLGLFGVNMPMLYGEGGARAFLRLQEEIMKRSDDQSLFAWSRPPTDTAAAESQGTGLLATSPADFASCGGLAVAGVSWNHQPYSLTNRGLSLEMPMVAWGMETYLAALDCEVDGQRDTRVGVFLRLRPEEGQYERVWFEDGGERLHKMVFAQNMAKRVEYRKIYVKQRDEEPTRRVGKKPAAAPAAPTSISTAASTSTSTPAVTAAASEATTTATPALRRKATPIYGFHIRTLPIPILTAAPASDPSHPLSEVYTAPGGRAWSDAERIATLPPGGSGTVAAVWLCGRTGKRMALKVGFDAGFNPVVQYGGMLYSPVRPPVPPQSVEAMLHPAWMAVPRSDYLFRGDRGRGVDVDGFPWRVRVAWETVGEEAMWVLDIEES